MMAGRYCRNWDLPETTSSASCVRPQHAAQPQHVAQPQHAAQPEYAAQPE
jgi:hypothetical protein